jgi:hypothetical protein
MALTKAVTFECCHCLMRPTIYLQLRARFTATRICADPAGWLENSIKILNGNREECPSRSSEARKAVGDVRKESGVCCARVTIRNSQATRRTLATVSTNKRNCTRGSVVYGLGRAPPSSGPGATRDVFTCERMHSRNFRSRIVAEPLLRSVHKVLASIDVSYRASICRRQCGCHVCVNSACKLSRAARPAARAFLPGRCFVCMHASSYLQNLFF